METLSLKAELKGTASRIPMFKHGKALLSLRDSGHSLPTALGEVVDNAIEARAHRIRIELQAVEETVGSKKVKHVSRIAVADDGDGMDIYTLQHYLQIGFSSRYMSTKTMGKYGVGAKLAAINFARRIDVWSRQDGDATWKHVRFDLDDALRDEEAEGKGDTVFIDPPDETPIPKDLLNVLPNGSGTLVVWDRIDRLEHGRGMVNFNEQLLEIQKELSRMFREYLDGGIIISVQGTDILPHDPLFLMKGTWGDTVLTKEKARQSKDNAPRDGVLEHFEAEVIADVTIPVGTSNARIRVTLYPHEVTRKRYSGGDTLAKQLRVPENEGAISFMRMKREIAYTTVPRILPLGVKDSDRFIGIEVSFDPILDDFFGVRNVKRGVEPHGELRDRIREVLGRFIPTARKMLEERWGRVSRESNETTGTHAPIMDALRTADVTMPKGKVAQLPKDEELRKLDELARDVGHTEKEAKEEYLRKIRELPFVIESVDFPGKTFIDVTHLGHQVIIRVNTRHRFYRELWEPLQKISTTNPAEVSGEDAVKAARRAVEGLALMVAAYGKAQSMAPNPDQFTDLTEDWGKFIDTMMGKVKDVL